MTVTMTVPVLSLVSLELAEREIACHCEFFSAKTDQETRTSVASARDHSNTSLLKPVCC